MQGSSTNALICAIFGCSNTSKREKDMSFRLPAIVTHQGDKAEDSDDWLSQSRRNGLTCADSCERVSTLAPPTRAAPGPRCMESVVFRAVHGQKLHPDSRT